MKRIMLDLETMGNSTQAAIVAIGAVEFGEGKIVRKFHLLVDLQSSIDAGLVADASTFLWWMEQSYEARKIFCADGDRFSLREALIRFKNWCHPDAEVWGNGASFDNAILSTAYRKIGLEQPWKFWNDRCYRTIKNLHRDVQFERVGLYHNAVDDAESQALHLMKILAI